MENKPNNPSAFPMQPSELNGVEWGMDLRDYFAAKAMQAYISNSNSLIDIIALSESEKSSVGNVLGQVSYEIADAMLKQREL